MAVCKYFASRSGCRRGDRCKFQHPDPQEAEQTQPSPHPGLDQHSQNTSTLPIRTVKISEKMNNQASPQLCRFFHAGNCKHGDDCRFKHEIVDQESTDPKIEETSESVIEEDQTPSEEHYFRRIGGAAVEFGPGAEVADIKFDGRKWYEVRVCHVVCMWYKPSKIALIEFGDTASLNKAWKALRKTKVLGRKLTHRTKIDKSTSPWRCLLKLGNLDISTTSKMLKDILRQKCFVTFGRWSYSSSRDEVSQALERLLSSEGPLVSWNVIPSKNRRQNKALAVFSSQQQAKKVIERHHRYKHPLLASSKIFLSQLFKTKIPTLWPIYNHVSAELANIQRQHENTGYLEIKAYHRSKTSHRSANVHITCDDVQTLAKVSPIVAGILTGYIAKGPRDKIWHDYFLKKEAMAVLNDIGKKHHVAIFSHSTWRTLQLYGRDTDRAAAESALLKTVDDLSVRPIEIDCDKAIPEATHQAAYRRIVKELGRETAQLVTRANKKRINIHGSEKDAEWAKRVMGEEIERMKRIPDCHSQEEVSCIVCWNNAWEDDNEVYMTSCGHIYDQKCLASQCHQAEPKDFPIRCLGESGSCATVLSLQELGKALIADDLEDIMYRSFQIFTKAHPEKYQLCPAGDCEYIHDVAGEVQQLTCSYCSTVLCCNCRRMGHDDLTCEQARQLDLGDEAFEQWKNDNDARDCPACKATIEKVEGCNHMQCGACSTHICWVCMKAFTTTGETYDHMNREHGGVYEYNDNDDQGW